MYIVIGCWFYIIRPSVQSALSPYFSLCLCHFELSLYCKASNNNNNNNKVQRYSYKGWPSRVNLLVLAINTMENVLALCEVIGPAVNKQITWRYTRNIQSAHGVCVRACMLSDHYSVCTALTMASDLALSIF